MKQKNLIFFCLLFLFSCQKEKIEDPNFIGKWVLVNGAVENREKGIVIQKTNCNDDLLFSTSEYGSITVQIEADGTFTFDSNYGKEVFHLISKTEREILIKNYNVSYSCSGGYPSDSYSASGFDLVLRNKKGQKFKFPAIYIPQVDRLVIVPWLKGVKYAGKDRVYNNYNAFRFGSDLANTPLTGLYYQSLGKFRKL